MAKSNRVCLCLNGATLGANLARLEAEKYFDPSLDLAELRLDFMLDFSSSLALERSLVRLCRDLANCSPAVAAQFILTLRRAEDGGRCPDSLADGHYLDILRCCLQAIPQLAYFDLDASLLQRALLHNSSLPVPDVEVLVPDICTVLFEQLQIKCGSLLVSVHNFGTLPSFSKLRQQLSELERLPLPAHTLFKFALMVVNSAELLHFYQFADHLKEVSTKAYILLAMGEFGSSSRVLCPHIGSEWSFCGGRETLAPGQFLLDELVEIYHYRSINAKTSVYGVVGDPVSHSRSPELHNSVYWQHHWNAVYLRFRVDDLQCFLALRELLPIHGISCTLPHKETLAAIAVRGGDQLPPFHMISASTTVRLLGAANTFYCQRDGRWFAENTDVRGFIQPLLDLCARQTLLLAGKKAVIIGAGGAARAVLYALLCEGVDCEIYNRTLHRAKELQDLAPADLPGKVVKAALLEQGLRIPSDCDLLIQTTSFGLHAGDDPIPAYQFCREQIVYDLIYSRTTMLCRAARAAALVLDGSAMLKTQALAQIELFARYSLPHT